MDAVPWFGLGLRSEGSSCPSFRRDWNLVFTIQPLAAGFLEKTAVPTRSACCALHCLILVCSHVAAPWPCLSSRFLGRSGGYPRDLSGVARTSKWDGGIFPLGRHVSPLGSLGNPKSEKRFLYYLEGKPAIFCFCTPLGAGDCGDGRAYEQILRALLAACGAGVGAVACLDSGAWRSLRPSKRAEGSRSVPAFFGGACGRSECLDLSYGVKCSIKKLCFFRN